MSKNLPEIISVGQLRDEIGDPTKNPQFGGYVSDDMLQNIIDRHVEWLESRSLQRLQEGKVKPIKQTEPVTVNLSENSSSLPGLASGDLDPKFFPYATEGIVTKPSTHSGESLDYNPRLITKAKKAFYSLYAFDIENGTVLASPKDLTEVTLFLPERKQAVREIMTDTISEVNSNIIEKAQRMLEARSKEFAEPAIAAGAGGFSTDD